MHSEHLDLHGVPMQFAYIGTCRVWFQLLFTACEYVYVYVDEHRAELVRHHHDTTCFPNVPSMLKSGA